MNQLEILQLQKENIELKGMVLGNQLRDIEKQISLRMEEMQIKSDPSIDSLNMEIKEPNMSYDNT